LNLLSPEWIFPHANPLPLWERGRKKSGASLFLIRSAAGAPRPSASLQL
jgi:hypothetical protein